MEIPKTCIHCGGPLEPGEVAVHKYCELFLNQEEWKQVKEIRRSLGLPEY